MSNKTTEKKIKTYFTVMEMTVSEKNIKKILYFATIYCTQEKKNMVFHN